MRGEPTVYRMRSDMAQHMYSERFIPPRRQYSAEMGYEMGHGRGRDYLAGPVEGPYEHPAAYSATSMVSLSSTSVLPDPCVAQGA